jgi:hypothetical protein
LEGLKGIIPLKEDDEITLKLGMLFEGECEGGGSTKAWSFGPGFFTGHEWI